MLQKTQNFKEVVKEKDKMLSKNNGNSQISSVFKSR